MKGQELFLDMSRHTKTITFKSIKNIYSTLTEGKADEVIYQKDKKTLIDSHVFNQKYILGEIGSRRWLVGASSRN